MKEINKNELGLGIAELLPSRNDDTLVITDQGEVTHVVMNISQYKSIMESYRRVGDTGELSMDDIPTAEELGLIDLPEPQTLHEEFKNNE